MRGLPCPPRDCPAAGHSGATRDPPGGRPRGCAGQQVFRIPDFQAATHEAGATPTPQLPAGWHRGSLGIWKPGNLAICRVAVHAQTCARLRIKRLGSFVSPIRLDQLDQHGSDAASDGLVNSRLRTGRRTLSQSRQWRATVPSTAPTALGSSPCACPPCDCGNLHGAATRWNCSREYMLTADARPGQVLMHRNA